MSSLADAFLKDFDEGPSSDEFEASDSPAHEDQTQPEQTGPHPGQIDIVECAEAKPLTGVREKRLLDDTNLLDFVSSLSENQTEAPGSRIELLQKINVTLQAVDSEILQLLQICKEIYDRRFPELEPLVPMPLDYLFVMRRLGNDIAAVNDVNLGEQLNNQSILAVSVAASVSVGRPLSEEQLRTIMEAADEVDRLVEIRSALIQYIEARMADAAPNLTALVGCALAARLVAHAGGLVNLATMPSQNLLVVGGSSYARRTAAVTAAGNDPALLPAMARQAGKGFGVLYGSDLVQQTQPAYRSRALRLVGGKAALAVRKDVYNNDGTNTVGKQFRQLIVENLKKVQAPPPARLKKPLPIPEERPKARRGGRRKRRWKEKYGMTETRKKANRLDMSIDAPAEPERLQNEDDDDDDVF